MSLHTRLRLLLAIVLLALFSFNGISHYNAAHREQEQALKEQAERTHTILMSMRRVYHQQFIKSGIGLSPETLGFLPAHAMNRISQDISSRIDEGFTFNNVSDLPRNPYQTADAHELEVMDYFRSNPSQEVFFKKYKDEGGESWFQYARPIWVEEYCLKCHGKRSEAPLAIQEMYDTAYDYKVGDLRGLLSIRLSAKAVNERHDALILGTIATSLALFLISFLVLSFLIHRFVNQPISKLVHHVNLVARSTNSDRVPSFSGEFAMLADSVNNMAQKIEEDRLTLLANEQTFRTLVEGTNAAPWSLDLQTRRFNYLGPQFETMLGFTIEDCPDFQSWTSRIHPEDRDRALLTFENTVHNRKSHQQEYRMFSTTNLEVWVKSVATVVPEQDGLKMIGFLVEITDQKKADRERISLERKILQAQKLESLSVLAGGVAHDFNNLLSGILGHADLALMDLGAHAPARDDVKAIITASRRAADLSKQMLAYSGKGKFVVEKIHLGDLVQEIIHLLKISISKNATLNFECVQDLPLVEGDATQIRQIVMNLITNASEAFDGKTGTINLTIGKMFCRADYIQSFDQAVMDQEMDQIPEGLYVFMEIADTGCGLDKETLQKIFDPFFTTKFTGRGLGLAAVLGIVRGHNGAIKTYSELGTGTTFKVLLPGLECEAGQDQTASSDEAEQWSGTGTVMVVDDDPIVRAIACRMLECLGFQTMVAEDGLVALELFRKHGSEISCVLLDLTMPRMDGKQVFREIRLLSGNMPVIMSSGYNEQDVIQSFLGKGLAGFIQKPYQLDELKMVLRQALD